VHEEVSALLSAYLDDELTQAEAQRVRVHLEECGECREAFEEMKALREAARSIEFPGPSREDIERLQRTLSVRGPRLAGWLLVVAAMVAWAGYAVWHFLTGPLDFGRLTAAALVVGFFLLLASVLRQRLLELPSDRYRRVRR
jgi:anti-sigma factor RsiW